MALGVTTETGAGGNLSWLGSRHGVANARTGTLKASAFTEKFVKSGTPVAVDAEGLYVPYTAAEGQAIAGFIINDANVAAGDEPVAILDHGRVIVAKLPVDFTVPDAPGAFIYV